MTPETAADLLVFGPHADDIEIGLSLANAAHDRTGNIFISQEPKHEAVSPAEPSEHARFRLGPI